MPIIYIKKYLVQKLLLGHTDIHARPVCFNYNTKVVGIPL